MALPPIVSPVVDLLICKLAYAAWQELGLLWGVKDDIKKLNSLLLTVWAVLDDAERTTNDKALYKWLRDLKDTALDADDAVDEL